ncbi:MAG: S9 family peptidase [Propionibacteriaceae bacterium]|jgi:dipeptidyl aminopeptidase/acylaminoacyl peptidase|nr:S9 family peptidase [Propionibacteriaceae bacterium]
MRPENLEQLYTLSQPALHPSGEWAVVSAKRQSFAADAYVGQLWKVPLSGGTPVRITRGFSDGAPKFSPDGKLIAFLRGTPGAPPQLAVVSAAGGEPMVVTNQKLGVSEFVFSPDGQRIFFAAAVPEEGRYGTIEGVGPAAEDPRHITSFQFQMNARGYTADQRIHVFVIDTPDPSAEPPIAPIGRAKKAAGEDAPKLIPTPVQLTSGDYDHTNLFPATDGVIVVSARHAERDNDLRRDAYLVPADGGEPRLLNEAIPGHILSVGAAAISGDSLYLVAGDFGDSGRGYSGSNPGLWVLPAAGGVPTRLTEPEPWYITEVNPVPADAGAVLVIANVRGNGQLYRVTPDGEMTAIPAGEGAAVHFAAYAATKVLVTAANADTFDEVVDVTVTPQRLTDFSAEFRAQAGVLAAAETIATSADGYPVHGWIVKAANYDPNRSNPVMLMVHGGPFASYGSYIFDEAQVMAAAGYTVVMCNPRGSAGYGEAHGKAIIGDLGNLDHQDIIAFLDHALATVPGLDADRVGVMGGSYGGYMTAWLLGHETRFKGGIVERGYLDPPAFVGSSDIGWFFVKNIHGADKAEWERQSPTSYVDQVVTPTLVIQSEQDLRCPIAQALRYFTELKLRGIDVELLVFPGENHELSRSGRPLHRKARFEHILTWWAKHLPVNE